MDDFIIRPKIGILGHGEIGQALEELYNEFENNIIKPEILIKDLKYKGNPFARKELDVLNICIPYSKDFKENVIKEIKATKSKLTIIHSTIPPYTTKEIRGKSGYPVVHSPVRGIHPDLVRSLELFTKYVGAENHREAERAKKHIKAMGISKVYMYQPAVITEVNKILSTTYYGICIAFTKYVDDILNEYKIEFKRFEHFNESYNRGYRRMRMRKVVRPTLYPPEPEGLKSHCIQENAALLHELIPHMITKEVLSLGKNPEVIKGEIYKDRAWLFSEYWGKDKSIEQISQEVKCSEKDILLSMKNNNIPKSIKGVKR